MHLLDWLVVVGYLLWIVIDGLRRTRGATEVEGYFLAHRSLPWWAVGLSVMATQLSAITLVGTTGQAYADGMRFIQFYFGLPIAMVLLSITLVPFFYRSGVYTAYEYLERRFDVKTRTLASVLFLTGRSMSTGAIISAPAVILSIVFHWNLTLTILAIGAPTIVYTMFGGVQAVTWTDVKQMGLVVGGLICAVVALIIGLPHDVSVYRALHIAGAAGRLNTIDFHFDPRQTYTFWSGILGGLFLHLSYFGCDQSQVQRYLTAKSLTQARHSLLMSAFVKIPLQVLVLLVGVFMFLFYVFNPPPMLFNAQHRDEIERSARAAEFHTLESDFQRAFDARRSAANALVSAGDDQRASARAAFRQASGDMRTIRAKASALVGDVSGGQGYNESTGDTPKNDVNYVFPTFVTTSLPPGLVGLVIAAIFAAAMSATAGELSATASSTVIDIYRRLIKPDATDAHYLRVSRMATAFWGIVACAVAHVAVQLGSLIEVVNRIGSIFYGSLLGVFVLALTFRRATGTGAFVGLLSGIVGVVIFAFHPATRGVSYLWHNPIGVGVVMVVGVVVSLFTAPPTATEPNRRT
ncbi:MAG TPA: sodium:solute symporter [Vicinamibacterales bacterium]|jgi:SSS family solute:Na+ symporter|nr:sodium:solute symporter [Vicinamibacterales bacterium]